MTRKEKKPRTYRGVQDEIREQQKKLKDMSFREKLKYFWDYYKLHTIIAVAALILLGTLIHDISTSKDYTFCGIMLNSFQLIPEALEDTFSEYAGLDTDTYQCYIDTGSTISLQNYSQFDMAASQKLMALVQANELDAAVMDSPVFFNYALSEMFLDLRTVLSEEELTAYQDRLYYIDYAEVALANDESGQSDEKLKSDADIDLTTMEGLLAEAELHRHPEAMEQPVPVGIYMEHSPFMEQTASYDRSIPIFGVIVTSQRPETARQYLNFLWDETVDFTAVAE